ncbi:MAG: carbohydrate ABC transporter permease [Erysipelotrichaceae bacterium]
MNNQKTNRLYKLFIYVALLTFAISIVVPVGWVFLASIKEKSEFYGNPWSLPMGLYVENFVTAFTKANMGTYMLNSVYVSFLAIFLLLLIALPASYVLARYEFKGKKIIHTFLMAGLFINVNYIIVPIFLMLLDGDKWLRTSFQLSNVLLNNHTTLAIVYAATALPFTIYLLSGFFKTLPKAYEEAAYIDGCSHFKTMTKIMIPMARPSIITVILFNFLAFWNEYIIALTLLPNASKTLPVGLINLMEVQKTATDYGAMYAGLVMVMLPTLILYIMVQKKLTQGMSLGGLKD